MEILIKTPLKCQLASWGKGWLQMKMKSALISTSVHGKQEIQTIFDINTLLFRKYSSPAWLPGFDT